MRAGKSAKPTLGTFFHATNRKFVWKRPSNQRRSFPKPKHHRRQLALVYCVNSQTLCRSDRSRIKIKIVELFFVASDT
jgi:hypothetical protein